MRIAALLAFLVALSIAQDAPPPNPDAQAIDEAIQGLKRAHKEKLEADFPHYIKVLGEKWPNASAVQRKEILDLAKANLKSKVQATKNVTVEAMGLMGGGEGGKDGEATAKILIEEAGKKPTQDNVAYFSAILVNLGKLASKNSEEPLLKHLRYKDYDVVAAAVEGLGHHKDRPHDDRREIVGELLKLYTSASSAAHDPRATTTDKDRLKKLEGAMEHSLKMLTKQNEIRGAPNWWSWWQDTGKKTKSW
jgi:hypothetical protein